MLLIASWLGCISVCVCVCVCAFEQVFHDAVFSEQYLWMCTLSSFGVYETF